MAYYDCRHQIAINLPNYYALLFARSHQQMLKLITPATTRQVFIAPLIFNFQPTSKYSLYQVGKPVETP